MFRSLYRIIYGKKDAEVARLAGEVADLLDDRVEARKRADYFKNEADAARGVLERIESSYARDYEISDIVSLKKYLARHDCMEVSVVFHASAPNMDMEAAVLTFEHERKVLKLECFAVAQVVDPVQERFLGDMSHKMCVKLARSIGDAVTESLLRDAGWRPKL